MFIGRVLDRKKRITCAVQFSCFVLLGSNTAAWAFRGYYIVHVRNIGKLIFCIFFCAAGIEHLRQIRIRCFHRRAQVIIRQCYLENGNISSEFVETDAYSYDETEGVYYMDTSVLKAGDVLYKTDSQDTYTVSKRATLIGVYNVNKGYADFKQINILYQNDEYSIVRANTTYGLNVYDYIVLDGSAVSDDQIITNIKKTGTNKDTTVSGDDMAPENSPVPEG